jgi:hypothetical protein
MPTTTALQDVCCARLPASALAVLADLRREPGIRVAREHEHVWVLWDTENVGVLHRLLPVVGVELYCQRDGLWYRGGARLPAFCVPADLECRTVSLARAVVPQSIRAVAPEADFPPPIALGLARAPAPREATALRCTLTDLARWVEQAPTAALAALETAWAGGEVFVRGQRLPPVAGKRYWGERLLVPLGFRPVPDLPESALRRALGIGEDELAVLEADGVETIPGTALRPMTRAGVRLARRVAPS